MAEIVRAKPLSAWVVALVAVVVCALIIGVVAAPLGGSGLAFGVIVTALVAGQVVLFHQRARRAWLWIVAAVGLFLMPALPIYLVPAIPPEVGIKLCLLSAWVSAALALIGSRRRTRDRTEPRPWEELGAALGVGAVLLTGVAAVSGTHEEHAHVYDSSCEGVLVPLEDGVIFQIAFDDEDPQAQYLQNGEVVFDVPRYFQEITLITDISYGDSRENIRIGLVGDDLAQYRGLLISVLSLGIVNDNDPGFSFTQFGGAECKRGEMRGDELDVTVE